MGGFSDFVDDAWDDTWDATKDAGAALFSGGLSLVRDALKPDDPRQPGANPANDPAAIAERNRVAREEQIRRLLGGRESTVQTSPMGLAGPAPIATKSLLGS